MEAGELESEPLLRRGPALVAKWLARSVWRLKVSGLEHVPRRGPVILAANHVSLADGPVLAVAAGSVRSPHFLGKAELFLVPLLGWYLRRTGVIPLERRGGDISAMRAAVEHLRGGGCLALFPEGTRSKTGVPGAPKAGVSFLAGRTGAEVVPVRLVNTARAARLYPLEARFGPGLRFEGDIADRDACLAFARDVMAHILAL
ncbi:MAG: 1-acyl-sn-glycerol-3-phosphate acyltransferase [Elusimicrobia bacterium]|nr:1-acyl-sn-glycerol-3-phosphate acyltransferase [Elusimicrobiota bacterium]